MRGCFFIDFYLPVLRRRLCHGSKTAALFRGRISVPSTLFSAVRWRNVRVFSAALFLAFASENGIHIVFFHAEIVRVFRHRHRLYGEYPLVFRICASFGNILPLRRLQGRSRRRRIGIVVVLFVTQVSVLHVLFLVRIVIHLVRAHDYQFGFGKLLHPFNGIVHGRYALYVVVFLVGIFRLSFSAAAEYPLYRDVDIFAQQPEKAGRQGYYEHGYGQRVPAVVGNRLGKNQNGYAHFDYFEHVAQGMQPHLYLGARVGVLVHPIHYVCYDENDYGNGDKGNDYEVDKVVTRFCDIVQHGVSHIHSKIGNVYHFHEYIEYYSFTVRPRHKFIITQLCGKRQEYVRIVLHAAQYAYAAYIIFGADHNKKERATRRKRHIPARKNYPEVNYGSYRKYG